MPMSRTEYEQRFSGEDSPGWEAITAACEGLYPGQEPRHLAPPIHPLLGGPDPISGVSFYNSTAGGTPHVHCITYGMSALHYDPELAGGDFSGRGFEFTARVAPNADDANGPMWMISLMNNLARYLDQSERWFEAGHFVNGRGPIRQNTPTSLTAIEFFRDVELGAIETPHGRVEFLQIVGLTGAQYETIAANGSAEYALSVMESMRNDNPMLIIDLAASPV